MQFQLRRVAIRPDGAFGVLLHEGQPICVTIERTYPAGDLDNPGPVGGGEYPKILPGTYRCTRTTFYHGKPAPYETYEILVKGHSRLLFHKAATENDLDGCVGLGSSFGAVAGATAVLFAPAGLGAFLMAANGEVEIELVVSDPVKEAA